MRVLLPFTLTGMALLMMFADRTAALALAAVSGSRAVVYMTPDGQPGYEPGSIVPVQALPWSSHSFASLKDGTVVQLLPSSPDSDAVAVFATRIEIRGKRDIVVMGLGARTVIRGQSLESVRGGCRPRQDGEFGCAADIEIAAGAGPAPTGQSSVSGGTLLAALLDALPTVTIVSGAIPAFITDGSLFAIPAFGPKRLATASCIDLTSVDGVSLEDLVFENCWLTAIRAVSSRHIAVRRATILGGSYGLVVRGALAGEDTEREAHHVTVEDVHWIQDTSAYENGDPWTGQCEEDAAWVEGCPGEMWRRIPWGSSHHGTYEHMNGALLAGHHVQGDIVFRRNTVENAYNGIRLTARECSKAVKSGRGDAICRYNENVWVYDNLFSYVRDNPVEFEHWVTNAHVFRNRFHNAHAWLSFDGAGGGPVYVYANRGWFDDMPSKPWSDRIRTETCSRRPDFERPGGRRYDSRFDRRFDYGLGVWYAVGVLAYAGETPQWMDPAEMSCEQSTRGRVIKIGMPDPAAGPEDFDRYPYLTRGPLYVFNNSWYVRAPITGSGMAKNLKHWNNAVLFCEEGTPGYDPELCEPLVVTVSGNGCGPGLKRYFGERGTLPFFDCFRWHPLDGRGEEMRDLPNEFDFDVSSIGFPPELQARYGMERHGRVANPGFRRPEIGDFSLIGGAAAATSACSVQAESGELSCEPSLPGFAGAVTPNGNLYTGPGGAWFQPPVQ